MKAKRIYLSLLAVLMLCLPAVSLGAAAKTEKPVFDPPTGRYTEAQAVELSCKTPGTIIYYTLDGTAPAKEHGTPYSGPIKIGETTLIRAVAISETSGASAIVEASYAIEKAGDSSLWLIGGLIVFVGFELFLRRGRGDRRYRNRQSNNRQP